MSDARPAPAPCRRLLWIDCTAGAAVGVAVLALAGWLSALYGLPRPLVVLMGVANLAYASFSFSLAVRRRRPRVLLLALVGANVAWGLLCVRWAVLHAATATPLGMATLLGEGLFVAGLGLLEWRCRDALLDAPPQSP